MPFLEHFFAIFPMQSRQAYLRVRLHTEARVDVIRLHCDASEKIRGRKAAFSDPPNVQSCDPNPALIVAIPSSFFTSCFLAYLGFFCLSLNQGY